MTRDVGPNSLLRSGSLNIAAGVSSGALAFAFTMLVTHSLDVRSAGSFFTLVASATVLSTVIQLGIPAAGMKWLADARGRGVGPTSRRILLTSVGAVIGIGTLTAVAVSCLAPEVAGVLVGSDEPMSASAIRWMAVAVLLDALITTLLRAGQGLGATGPYVKVAGLMIPVGRVLVLGFAIWVAPTFNAVILAWVLPLFAGLAWSAVSVRRVAQRTTPWATALQPGFARRFAKFSLVQAVANITNELLVWADVVLLMLLATADQAAVYACAGRFLAVGSLFQVALFYAAGPEMARLIAGRDMKAARAVYSETTVWLCSLTLPAFLGLTLYAKQLMSLFGPDYAGGTRALQILALGMLASMFAGPARTTLSMAGLNRLVLADNAAALLANLLLNVALIPMYGATGAACAWAAAMIITAILPLIQVRTRLGLVPWSRKLGLWYATGVVAFFTVQALTARLPLTGALRAAIGVGGASILYAGALLALGEVPRRRPRMAIRLVPRRESKV